MDLKRNDYWQCFFLYTYVRHPVKHKQKDMRSLLYILAVILIIGWLLGVFAWNATGLIHILIVLAVISLLFGIIRRA
ncbi:MAG TPA: lmo0937 family membrane protein [Flavisolibacter sp.]